MLVWWSMADAAEQAQEQTSNQAEQHFNESRREASLRAIGAFESRTQAPPAAAVAPPVETPPAPPVAAPAKSEPPPDDLSALRKQELHLRRQIAEERAAWEAKRDREQAELQPRLGKLTEYEQRLAAAKDDPIAYLQAAGYTEADFDHLARRVYAASPEAQKDPKTKAAAEAAAYQTKAQREAIAEAKAAREEAAAVRRLLEERDQQASMAERERAHRAQIVKAAETSPLARARLLDEKLGGPTWDRMKELVVRMHTDSSPYPDMREVPAPDVVLKAYEQERRAELESDLRALGIDPAILTQQPATAAPAQSPGPPQPGGPVIIPAQPNGLPRSPTLAPNAGAPTAAPPKGRLSRDQLIKEASRLAEIAKP